MKSEVGVSVPPGTAADPSAVCGWFCDGDRDREVRRLRFVDDSRE